jgi:asparagine synthase (glutamine-hydrolysing)
MFMDIASKVRQRNLTYLGVDRFESMNSCLQSIKQRKIPGDFLEFGIALGGSAICIASELDRDRRFVGFDVFGMIPPPGEKDGLGPNERYETIKTGRSAGIGGDPYYGYVDNLLSMVVKNFAEFGLAVDGDKISFVPGLYETTLPRQPERAIAFAHIDCDWYEPVMACLAYVAPRLSPGGVIILDDYHDWPGCRRACDEFRAGRSDLEIIRERPHCVLRKRREANTLLGRLRKAVLALSISGKRASA